MKGVGMSWCWTMACVVVGVGWCGTMACVVGCGGRLPEVGLAAGGGIHGELSLCGWKPRRGRGWVGVDDLCWGWYIRVGVCGLWWLCGCRLWWILL